MLNAENPSRTALTAAAARAAHLVVDAEPRIFTDSLAATLLGEAAQELIGYHRAHGTHPVLVGARAQVVVRAHYTEHRLARCVEAGVDQYVLLGAGLDTVAHRSPYADRLTVFEVDHPATQRWKRGALAAAGIAEPAGVRYVAVDLEADRMLDHLVDNGFRPDRPAMVSWLGVSVYLTEAAIARTLSMLGRLAPGTHLVTDHLLPQRARDARGQAYADAVMPVAAQGGEPWLTFLDERELAALLTGAGFTVLDQADQRAAVPAALWRRTDALSPSRLAVLAHAVVA